MTKVTKSDDNDDYYDNYDDGYFSSSIKRMAVQQHSLGFPCLPVRKKVGYFLMSHSRLWQTGGIRQHYSKRKRVEDMYSACGY